MSVAACPACVAAPAADRVAEVSAPTMQLSVPGVHCAACMGKVERRLRALPGVEDARVNLSLKRVSLRAMGVEEAEVIAALDGIGYEALPLDQAVLERDVDEQGRALLTRMAVAGFAMMNVMLLSVSVWSGAGAATRDMFHMISGLIALPVLVYSAQPFFRNAWAALRVWTMNMDVPISLAILLAAGMSLVETFLSGPHAYFDAALSLTFFLLIGRYLDHRSRASARSAAAELAALESHTARREGSAGPETVAIRDLRVGDKIIVPTGGRVPVDGVLLDRGAEMDRSFLTGESVPVQIAAGAAVQAGEMNLGAPLRMEATAVGEDTTLRRVSALVEMAEASRNSYTALADRAARIYAPAVHLLALAAFLGWMAWDGDLRHAVNVAVAVLIITCPCALGLAVPAVATAAIGKLFGRGVLVKHGTALERIAEVDTVVFDKTGTLTRTGAHADVAALSDEAASVAVALAQVSDHPVSRAVVAALPGVSPVALTDVVEVPGQGIEGLYRGGRVRLGRGNWVGAEAATGLSLAGVAHPLNMVETLRPGVAEALAGLKAQGLAVHLLTGDRAEAARPVAEALGIASVHAGISGEAKHAFLSELKEAGQRVLMVGDGLNDTAALAVAHASIAPASGLDAPRTAADVVILKESFEDLPEILRTARASVALSRQNFGVAALYNLVAVPIAVMGFVTPLIAALAMSASSITVLLNALRVRRSS